MRQIVMIGFLQAHNCTNLMSSWHHPASYTDRYEDFARLVVPAWQRRDLYHKNDNDTTWRETLGIPIPQRGDWRP